MKLTATIAQVLTALVSLSVCVTAPAASLNATWTLPANGDWTDAANWDTAAFPNNGADTYDVFITNNFTVTHAAGTPVVIDNLTVDTGNTLRYEEAGSTLSVLVSSTVAGRVLARDSATVVLGTGTLTDAGLEAVETIGGTANASLSSSATAYVGSTSGNADRTLAADGTGTQLNLAALTSLTRPTSQFADITIRAADGGSVDLSALSGFTPNGGITQSHLNVTADGGTVDLSLVSVIAERVNYRAVNGGTILGSLTSATNASLTKGGGGSVLDFSALTTVARSSITAENSGVIVLGAGTNIDDTSLIARKTIGGTDNAALTVGATSWAGSLSGTTDRRFSADGAGTVVDLSALTSLTRPTSQFADLTIEARSGGMVDLSALGSFTPNGGSTQSHLNVTADSGTIDLSAMTAISDRVHYKAVNGGTILGSLTSATNASLTKGGGGSVLDFSALTTVAGSSITAENSGVIVLGAGTNIDDTSLIARKTIGGTDNAALTVGATSWAGSLSGTTDRRFSADGAGTVVDLSALTSLTRPTSQFADLTIEARSGGMVDLSALGSFTPNGGSTQSHLNVTADSGTIDLSAMTAISDRVHYKAVNGGTILGSLTSATNASLTKGGGGSVLDFSALTTVAGSSITAENSGVIVLGAGTNIDDTSLIARKTIGGTDNAALTVGATSWAGSLSGTTDRRFSADGAGTVVDLSALTSLTRPTSQFADLTIEAKKGGTLVLSGLSAFTPNGGPNQSGLNLVSSGSGSLLDVSALTALEDGNITIADGGSVALGALAQLAEGTLELDATPGAADVAVAANFNLGDGGVVDTNGATSALLIGTPGAPVAGAVNVFADGALGGTGTVVGDVHNFGTVAPGNSPGTLTVDGDYSQAAGATLAIEIASLAEFDVLDITGAANLDGTLEISFSGYAPASGDEFLFLLAGAGLNGSTFASAPSAVDGFFVDVVYGATSASLVIGAAVPLPAAMWLLLGALGALGLGARRAV